MKLQFPEHPPRSADELNLFTAHNFEALVHLADERLSFLRHDALDNKEEYIRDVHMKCLAGAAERDGKFDLLDIKHAKEIRDEYLDTINYVAAEELAYHFNS